MAPTKKKVVKKVPKLNEVKSLTEVEMLKIDVTVKDMRLIEVELVAMQNKKKVLDLEFASEIEKKKDAYRQLTERKLNLIKGLSEKYELKTDLTSYDPLTGEIKDE